MTIYDIEELNFDDDDLSRGFTDPLRTEDAGNGYHAARYNAGYSDGQKAMQETLKSFKRVHEGDQMVIDTLKGIVQSLECFPGKLRARLTDAIRARVQSLSTCRGPDALCVIELQDVLEVIRKTVEEIELEMERG
jgi:hypothetical protein